MVSSEREQELYEFWSDETNDPETKDWRESLTDEEATLVRAWDDQYADGKYKIYSAIALQEIRNDFALALQRQEPARTTELVCLMNRMESLWHCIIINPTVEDMQRPEIVLYNQIGAARLLNGEPESVGPDGE